MLYFPPVMLHPIFVTVYISLNTGNHIEIISHENEIVIVPVDIECLVVTVCVVLISGIYGHFLTHQTA